MIHIYILMNTHQMDILPSYKHIHPQRRLPEVTDALYQNVILTDVRQR